jgi:PAS domain S-box-containing protein
MQDETQKSHETRAIRPRIPAMPKASPLPREALVELFDRLFANSNDAMNLFALRDGTVIVQYEAAFKVTGYSRADFASRPIESFYPPQELPKVAAAFAKMAESGFVAEHVRMYYKSGELRDLWIRSYVIQREPEPICLVHTIDVTDEKRKQEKAVHEGKLAALGEFAASLAHELGNTVQVLDFNANYLVQRSAGLTPEVVESVAKIRALSTHMAQILRNMQRFATLRPEVPKGHVSVLAAMRGALDMVEPFLRRHKIQVSTEMPRDIPPVIGVVSQIQQIFVIMFRNAAQAMMERAERRLHVAARLEGDKVIVSVEDSGGGIPEAMRAHLFETFATTKDEGAGLGLGLSIARKLANELGIGIEVESQADVGTSFHLAFPLPQAVHQGAYPRTALLMDDNPANLGAAAANLVRGGYLVFTATTANEAYEILRHHELDVVLAEIEAYPLAGVDFAKEARRYHRGPVILTGALDEATPAVMVAADAVLATPVAADELDAALANLGGAKPRDSQLGPRDF